LQLFLAFVVALSIAAALIPPLARWAPLIGLTDAPGPRKVHSTPVPRVGGIAMAVGILVPALFTVQPTPALNGMFVGLVVLLIVGVWDDRVNASPWSKLLGQCAAVALCMQIGGIRIDTLGLGVDSSLSPAVSWPLTFVFLVGVTNAVNLSDGLDGLAGGMAMLCLAGIALLAAASGNSLVTLVTTIEAGAILGFLRFNTHPARVFMGDGGSQVLGFTTGVLAILATQGENVAVSAALPLLLIGVPIVDTFGVIVRRTLEGRSPFSSDRNHLHHKLLWLGFSHHEAVILIYCLQATLFLLAYFLRFESDVLIIAIFSAFALAVLGTLRVLGRSTWRAHSGESPTLAARGMQRLRSLPLYGERLQKVALVAMGAGLAAYVAMTISVSGKVGNDVGMLCLLSLAALLIMFGVARTEASRTWSDRVAAYVGVVMIVYLDQTAPAKTELVTNISWTLLAMTGVAALVRFWLSSARRFEVTSLDVLVIFIAVVLPHLPGSVPLPEDLPEGITKAVILLYCVEALLGLELKRALPRAALALTFGIIAARWLVAPII
jgi:UDP-GlcNAc:undecaprenyl-phosphate/decaprenyl-phosphate GlcNAc-1-phosphate transferase